MSRGQFLLQNMWIIAFHFIPQAKLFVLQELFLKDKQSVPQFNINW